MKKVILVLSAMLILTGCHGGVANNEATLAVDATTISTTQEVTETITTISLPLPTFTGIIDNQISLDMTVEQLHNFFNLEHIEIIWPENYDNPSYGGDIVMDGRTYNFDGSFFFRAESIHASFDADGTLRSFNVINEQYASPQGVRVGDTREMMLQAHGNDYIPDNFGYEINLSYHYPLGEQYLIFRVLNGIVDSWGLTTRIAGYQ